MDLIVHGGAGGEPAAPGPRRTALQDATSAGAETETPLDAVETAVRHLEAAPPFNAGLGGAVQIDETVRTDAGVMTDSGAAGAVASLEGVTHAVSAARFVLEETPHVLMVGRPATALVASRGIAVDDELRTTASRDRFDDADVPAEIEAQVEWVRERFGSAEGAASGRHGTVGAVATDGCRIVSATSTGGRWFALAGRVGDVPQLGAGFYASDAGGASATGEGEAIVRTAVARSAVERLAAGDSPDRAAEGAIEALDSATGGRAGVIVLTPDGRAGDAYNTESMQTVSTDP